MTQSKWQDYDIMVVDDNPEELGFFADILEVEGYQVRTAMNGESALKSAQEKLPDLILLDILMPPGMNGYDVCRQLKAETRTCAIPVLFISAIDGPADKSLAFAVGGVDYIAKPFCHQELLARIKVHLDLRNALKRLEDNNARLQHKIDDCKQAEEALRVSEQNYRHLVENLHEGVWRIDAEASTTFVNPCMAEMLGYAINEMLGKQIFEFIDKQGVQITKHCLERRQQRIKDSYECEFIRKDGNKIYTVLSITTITTQDGKYTGAIASVQDITERKMAEDALRINEEKYRRLVENLPLEYFFYRHGADGIFTYLSPSITSVLGYSQQEGMKYYPQYLTDSPINKEAFRHSRLSIKGEQQPAYEIEVYHKDGSIHRLEVMEVPVRNVDGKIVLVEGIAHDISGRYKMEEKLKAALTEKEVLLREVHHRVKNNMQVISSLLKIQSNHVEDARFQEILAECQNRVQSMALVHEYLYKAEDLSAVDFKEYVQALTNELCQSYLIGSTNVTLEIEMEKISLFIDIAVPCGLIINELVSNALKHAFKNDRPGKIWISMHLCDNREANMIVSDNGIGMPPGMDFNTIESLGLYLVRMLVVKQLHGTVTLKSGPGTEFHIRFSMDGRG